VSDAGERHAVACPRYLLLDRIVGLTDKGGIMHVLSYQIEQEVRDGSLMILFADDEPEPLPFTWWRPTAGWVARRCTPS
jgi:hypothetical protein